ncbi:hypothetical protein ADN00_18405 [Ornatilinea apprima]|uniref:Carbohydrate kinase PfkB domain-containing protein n=1 Tax=Ornatilinea apprima TaxID=1134406 RepID=A0A0P6X7B6_9CHLR|nr:carbohydrate kinase family protein [Ornatilinea apprima]KPL70035.1 hypothetical protein ADN00_18405 [Ornatilinea apprima]
MFDFESRSALRFVIAGRFTRDFIIDLEGQPHMDIPGGGGIYSAVGLALWEQGVGLLGRIGEDFPQHWLEKWKERGFDTSGVKILDQALDLRRFIQYAGVDTPQQDNPISHFSQRGLPFPKTLLGYQNPVHQPDSKTVSNDHTLRLTDLPMHYLDATAVHLAPLDFLSHSILLPRVQQGNASTITIEPSRGSMDATFWDDIPNLVKGITAFHTNEEKIRALFHGRSTDLWEMAEKIASYGCEFVVIKRKAAGQYLYDATRKTRWIIPAYPARVTDPTGAGDAFCGGFLAGYRSFYDPVEAALCGNISASFVIEGSGPLYALDALPGLAQARLESLRSSVRKL